MLSRAGACPGPCGRRRGPDRRPGRGAVVSLFSFFVSGGPTDRWRQFRGGQRQPHCRRELRRSGQFLDGRL
eukprot:811982-Pyramimonas_sp.AAC.1